MRFNLPVISSSSFTAIPLVVASLLTACTTYTPPVAHTPVASIPKKARTVEDALQLKDDGRVVDAANTLVNVYEQSAAADRASYLFDAAQLYYSVQNMARVTDMLNSLKSSAPTSAYTRLLNAQLSLHNGLMPIAMKHLSDTRLSELSAAGKGVYWATMAEAYRLAAASVTPANKSAVNTFGVDGQSSAIGALHAYVKAEEFLTSTQELSANQESIWQLLAAQSETALRGFKTQTTEHAVKAWLDLALISKDTQTAKRGKNLAAWRKQYPNHVILDQRLLDLNNQDKAKLRHLALILPTKSKELGASARAVWEGFKSVQNKTPGPYPVKLYETDEKATTTINAYNAAVDKGAILIVGPLPRSALTLLAKRKLLAVPTVALNVIDTDSVPVNLYQFGLPISHEAKLIARAAKEKGFTDAIVLKGNSPLDVRSAEAFTKEWAKLSRPVKSEIQVSDAAAIGRATNTGNAVTTMLFVASDFRNALPSIKSMPPTWTVFGTSSLNTMSPEADKLDKNRHIYFVDSPSLIKAASIPEQLPPSIRKDVVSSRLYWLGVDVCRLSGLLLNEEVRFNRPVMDGATGTLRVTRDRMVERELNIVSLHEASMARYNTSDFARLADVGQKRH